jgi:hypothetical protein
MTGSYFANASGVVLTISGAALAMANYSISLGG